MDFSSMKYKSTSYTWHSFIVFKSFKVMKNSKFSSFKFNNFFDFKEIKVYCLMHTFF